MNQVVHISEACSLALHSMALLAQANGKKPLSVREMAVATGASEAHLAKVLQRLVKAGLVKSNRGPGGGFKLARSGIDITLLEVFEAIEGPLGAAECLLKKEHCLFNHCLFDGLLSKISSDFRDHLNKLSLDQAIK